MRSEILLNPDRQIVGIRHAWTFDEFYSAMAVQGLDTNGDGVFSADELKPLAEANIKPLKDFDYFTFVHVGDGDKLPLKPPENYYLDSDKGILTLHLTLPLDNPIDARDQEVQIDVYDPTFFVAFGVATVSPVNLLGASIKGCTAEIRKPDTGGKEAQALSEAFFSQLGPNSNFGAQFAQTVTVKCRRAILTYSGHSFCWARSWLQARPPLMPR